MTIDKPGKTIDSQIAQLFKGQETLFRLLGEIMVAQDDLAAQVADLGTAFGTIEDFLSNLETQLTAAQAALDAAVAQDAADKVDLSPLIAKVGEIKDFAAGLNPASSTPPVDTPPVTDVPPVTTTGDGSTPVVTPPADDTPPADAPPADTTPPVDAPPADSAPVDAPPADVPVDAPADPAPADSTTDGDAPANDAPFPGVG